MKPRVLWVLALLFSLLSAKFAYCQNPAVSLSSISLTFGSQTLGSVSGSQSITLSNNGNAPLIITNMVTTKPEFTISTATSTCSFGPAPVPVAAAGHCIINVTFAPAALGIRNGGLIITDNDGGPAGSTQVVALSGTGTAPPAPPPPAAPAAPSLISIAVTLKNPAGGASNAQQLVATGMYSDNTTQDLTGTVTWASLDESVMSVRPGGLATGNKPGQTTIRVVSGSVAGSISLTVNKQNNVEIPVIPQLSISVNPQVVQPSSGKLPPFVPIGVFVNDCEKSVTNLNGYSLQVTGSGLSLSPPIPGKCVLNSNLTIAPNAASGTFKIFLRDNNNNPVGYTDFAILDSTAAAIPGGLAPQVDVMYEVLSQNVCNDVFGKRVARNFYCVEVKIGNNSGHPLQVAGIGFSNHVDKLPDNPPIIQANTSYASTRAVLLREEVLSPRNVLYHSVQAAGLIMAGVQPFFIAPNASKHFAIAASIVSGPALAAISVVSPDRVIGQLNNLDDESFRDTLIIPNNTHIRTTVFVEKAALTEELQSVSDKYVEGR